MSHGLLLFAHGARDAQWSRPFEASRQALNAHVRRLCVEDGLTVLWTTHLFDEVQADDPLLILHRGRLVARGTAASLAEAGEDLSASFARLTEVAA